MKAFLTLALLAHKIPHENFTMSTPYQNQPIFISWSSGKDSAYLLHCTKKMGTDCEIRLFTTVIENQQLVAMHRTRKELVEAQTKVLNLPIDFIGLPWPCPNTIYEDRLSGYFARFRAKNYPKVLYGDLHLEDIRSYRQKQMDFIKVPCAFPIWSSPEQSGETARKIIDSGIRSVVVCIDKAKLDPSFLGRVYDEKFLADLPEGTDPCGEYGEFHTFCFQSPDFELEIPYKTGQTSEDEYFSYIDLELP